MSLQDLTLLYKAAGDADVVREAIRAFVDEVVADPGKLEDEEAVAQRGFAGVLNALEEVQVSQAKLTSVEAELEADDKEDEMRVGRLEVEMQTAQDAVTASEKRCECERENVLTFIFMLIKGRAIGTGVTFGALSEELATVAERILSAVGVVRRQTEDEHAGFIAKNDAFKKKKLLQLDSLAKNKDVIDLSRELLAMHGQGGTSSKRRRFAERLARLSEKSERIGSYGLKEAKEEEKNSSEEEKEEN